MYGYLGEAKGKVLQSIYREKVIFENLEWFNTDNFGFVVNDYMVYADIIGQFTGLQDKNGKDIYEGDILKVKTYNNEAVCNFKCDEIELFTIDEVKGEQTDEFLGEVKFDEGCLFINDIFLSALFGDMRFSNPIYEIEVIDNIYDNKDLLDE